MKILITILLLTSCSNQLLRQAPPLAPVETYYKFDKTVNKIYHNRCKKLNGKDRKCVRTDAWIEDMWSLFYPDHIIIKKRKCFR